MVTIKNKKELKKENVLKIKITSNIKKEKTNAKSNNLNYVKFKSGKNESILIDDTLFYGSKNVKTPEDWRQLGFNLVKLLRTQYKNVEHALILNEVNSESKQFFEGLYLGDYNFNKYKSQKPKIRHLYFYVDVKFENHQKTKNVIKEAKRKVNGQFLTRDWVNTTPEDANSKTISSFIKVHFKNTKNITIEEYKEKDLKNLNMNAHLAVNRASKYPAKTIKITYTPEELTNKTKEIVLIGKGLTYDSGGLSLKPSNSMTTMKADKAGAITLLGFMDVIGKQGSKNKITCYLGFAENMVNENSYRPDDVLVTKNGKRVHIKNTDAEGRLVLYDNLVLAQEENPNITEIVSIATLTGAAIYQFGNEAAGVVSRNKKLIKKIKNKGIGEDEIWCEAELHKFMEDSIKDDLGDISNVGTSNQGCQKAGLFLMEAISKKNKTKYIHLDIAGPAFIDNEFGTNTKGGTGFGVRSLYELYK